MKTKFLIAIYLLFNGMLLGQNRVKIVDAKTQKPIEKANVYCNDHFLGKTNSNGELEFKTKCKTIEIEADNYDDKKVSVSKNFTVGLVQSSEKSKKIQAITIRNESDPRALKILDQVVKKYKQNSPKSLEGYRFKKYSKISLDVDTDSVEIYRNFIDRRADSLAQLSNKKLKTNSKKDKDSLMEESFFNMAKSSGFFLWEKAEQFRYSKQYGEKIIVLDNRISGFKEPIYELMALKISNLDRIPRQISPDNRHLYRFFLADTVIIDDRKTFVIKFRELSNKQKQRRNKFTGSIFIDANTHGIKKIESTSTKGNQGNITSVWKLINGKWFLDTENIRFRMGEQEFEVGKKESDSTTNKSKIVKKTFGNYIFVRNRFFDVEINPKQNPSDFQGYTYSIQNSNGNLLNNYRTDTLTEREAKTYQGVDSLVQKYDIEKKVKTLTALLRGQIRAGKVNIDLKKLLSYNQIERMRLGIGLKGNEHLSTKFSPDVYLAYGFGDGKPKYSVGIDTRWSQNRNSIFRIEFQNDMKAFGQFNRNLWPQNISIFDGSESRLFFTPFYRFYGVGMSYEYDLTNALTAKVATHQQQQRAIGTYRFNGDTQNAFTDTNVTLTLKYSPKDKNMMTPNGKYTYASGFPNFFINVEKGLAILGGNINYTRADFIAIHQFRTQLGTSRAYLFGGISSGMAPLWKNFEILGGTSPNERFKDKLNFENPLAHYTMPSGTFYADKFVGFQLRHTLPFVFSMGNRHSRLMLGYNAVWGDFSNPSRHTIPFETPKYIYQEAGITWKNFLGTMYHIGLYHRIGYYTSSKTMDNLGITLGLGL